MDWGSVPGPPHLYNVVDAASTGPVANGVAPFWLGLVIDCVCSAESAEAFKFLVGRRRCDNGRAHLLCNLESEDRYTSSAKDKHGVAGLRRPSTIRARQAVSPAVVSVVGP